ncbi:MAG TPA: hypothetical protein VFE32_21875 [Puia sp.]|jgi:hypothetical protein|nr:hypothetical protein [Puia sp.]
MNAPAIAQPPKFVREENPLTSIVCFFKYWKILGPLSGLHIQTLLFWLLLIGGICYGPIYFIDHPRIFEEYIRSPSRFRPAFIIVCLSYFVIVIGNFLYLFEIYRQAVHAGSTNKTLQNLHFFSLLICVFCIIFCAVILFDLPPEKDMHAIVEKTERGTFWIFSLLFVVDLLMLIAKVKEIGNRKEAHALPSELREIRADKRFILNQMILIDVPVLLGVWFIGFFSERVDHIGFFFTTADNIESFKDFFTVGGIGMHIIFSQFIFIILNTRSLYRKIQDKMMTLKV